MSEKPRLIKTLESGKTKALKRVLWTRKLLVRYWFTKHEGPFNLFWMDKILLWRRLYYINSAVELLRENDPVLKRELAWFKKEEFTSHGI